MCLLNFPLFKRKCVSCYRGIERVTSGHAETLTHGETPARREMYRQLHSGDKRSVGLSLSLGLEMMEEESKACVHQNKKKRKHSFTRAVTRVLPYQRRQKQNVMCHMS